MLQITKDQMLAFKRHRLLTVKKQILNTLHTKFPEQAILGENWLEEFVRCSMDAARAILIDDAKQMQRFVCALFFLEHILKDANRLKDFAQVMLSEESVEARLTFVEENLLQHEVM